jgi:acetylornithine/succinyldiaminopimelate/putrescine aminotransferase
MPARSVAPSTPLARLHAMRAFGRGRDTIGLRDAVIERFLAVDPNLGQAIDEAWAEHEALASAQPEQLALHEAGLISWLQHDFVNFYEADAVNPYVPLAARGPWIVTSHGAVLHDSGGYGMLGFGHAPPHVLEAMSRPFVMANVMTASFAQRRLTDALRAEIGHARAGGCPYARFLCMNSGSESVTVAARISDILAHRATGPGGRYEGRTVKFLALSGGFHGRTDRPAQASSSSQDRYRKHLHSFRNRENLVVVNPNDVDGLRRAFEDADRDGVFFEMMLFEPVMGEGNPGLGVTRAFYDVARTLCDRMGTLLLADSIQAGLRAHGVLSIVDYPGFEDADPPDMETWSKAINAAQYPLSVLGMTERAAALYERGVYGNTMTGNPRAAEVGAATLEAITPALRENIRSRGRELVAMFTALSHRWPDVYQHAQGTGLLVSVDIDPRVPVLGPDGIETWCRKHGMGVIHGGKNALRFTPHFGITSAELALIGEILESAAQHFHLEHVEAAAR